MTNLAVFLRRALVPACAAAALVLGGRASTAQEVTNLGYMVFNSFSAVPTGTSGGFVLFSGQVTNQCKKPLPNGSTLTFEIDGVPFNGLGLTALSNGQSQSFSFYSQLPSNLKNPRRNTTSLGFVIQLPANQLGGIGEQKTSPCWVTLVPGVPM